MQVSLAHALLRRKELQQKVDQLKAINVKDLFEVKAQRRNVTENIDDIIAQVPKLKPEEVTAAYDWHARRLREVDLVIQQANHATLIEVNPVVMDDYTTK
jgi:Skp family chaperone for outer membrane proteins